jgi:hypothetical protein
VKYTLDTNIFIDGFRSEDAQVAGASSRRPPPLSSPAAAPSRVSRSGKDGGCCGITLITHDGDFKRLAPFVKGFRYAAPWPMADNAAR